MIAVVTRGHVRSALQTRDLYHLLESLGVDVYVNAWDRYETSWSWSQRDPKAAKRVLTQEVLSQYVRGLPSLRNVTVHPTPPVNHTACRVWSAPCVNHQTAFANMLSIYERIPASHIVSVRNDVLTIKSHNSILPESLSGPASIHARLWTHVKSHAGDESIMFATASCDLVVGNDAIMSGRRSLLIRHARHLLSRWSSALTTAYHVHKPHHEFLVVEMAREIGLCPPRATFVHITKTGGTTIASGLMKRCPRQVTGYGHSKVEHDVPKNQLVVTILRDPVERIRSQFFYWRDGSTTLNTRTAAENTENRKLFPTLSSFLDAAIQNTPNFHRVTTKRYGFTWDQHFHPQASWLSVPTRAHFVCFHSSNLVKRTQSLLDALHIPCDLNGIDKKNPTLPYEDETLSPAHMEWLRRTFRRDFELWNAACA